MEPMARRDVAPVKRFATGVAHVMTEAPAPAWRLPGLVEGRASVLALLVLTGQPSTTAQTTTIL